MRKYLIIIKLFVMVLVTNSALFAQDMGPSAYSKLTWDDISSVNLGYVSGSIGLTTDKKMYIWGSNDLYTINTNYTNNGGTYPIYQTTPFYVPSPAGETIKKVAVKKSPRNDAASLSVVTYFCLSESGKMYAWGVNGGLLETAWPKAVGSLTNTLADTTLTKRRPVQLTILGESSFVDFDADGYSDSWVAIGASGKAYHIGINGPTAVYTFAALPNPDGVDNATFKYTKVWCSEIDVLPLSIYLKGNNGKIYYTGRLSANYSTGIASIFPRNTPAPTLTSDENAGYVRAIAPREVPFPAGEDIIKMSVNNVGDKKTNYALSANGKAYIAGMWRKYGANAGGNAQNTFVVAPLKTAPLAGIEDVFITGSDTIFTLKSFVEMATPSGVTKIIDIVSVNPESSVGTLVVGDNNKVYFSGSISDNPSAGEDIIFRGNFLSVTNYDGYSPEYCASVQYSKTTTRYSWAGENINYEGTAKITTRINNLPQLGLISKTGRGYFVGKLSPNAGTGKTASANLNSFSYSIYPTPIANEQLLSCQTSAGPGGTWTGGPVTPPNTGVGTIDCSKTQIAPAPVAGVPSQTTLIVSINVTTAGTFSPITVSGSGMSLGNGVTSVSTTTTGVKTFYIPIQYDGSALTNTFQFTVGSAGSCTADLTKTPVKAITDVWTLDCLPSVGPALKK